MRARIALAAALALVGCGHREPLADDAPRPPSSAPVMAPAAVGASLVFPPVASASASAPEPAPSLGGGTPGHPRIRDSLPVLSNTGLDDVVVRRIVRQNFGRFRLCYEVALRLDPTISGTVLLAYRIDTTGAVSMVRDAGSTVGSPDLVACVMRAVSMLSFPSPTMGPVDVTDSIYFTPPSP